MTVKEFKFRYPLEDWVINPAKIEDGETLVWEDKGVEMRGEFIGALEGHKALIAVYMEGVEQPELINLHDTIVFRIRKSVKSGSCSCGAKHTSKPDYHLPYCAKSGT